MSMQTLRGRGRKRPLSGRNKKAKRARKNLWIDELGYKPTRVLDSESNSKVIAMLKTVFFEVQLAIYHQRRRRKQVSAEYRMQAKLKRKQLLIGVNAMSKALQAGTVACTLFADDIRPEMLKYQLHTLCKTKNVPVLSIQKLRDVTREALGFPSIVVGFKKDSPDFKSAIELVTSIYNAEEECGTHYDTEREVNPVPGTSAEISPKTEENHDSSEDEKPFEYLYYDPLTGKRAFIPEDNPVPYRRFVEIPDNSAPADSQVKMKTEPDLDADTEADTESDTEPEKDSKEKMSVDQIRGQKRKLERDSTNDDEGEDVSLECNMAKIVKLQENPGREKKKFKKSKKNSRKVTKKLGVEKA